MCSSRITLKRQWRFVKIINQNVFGVASMLIYRMYKKQGFCFG